MPTRYDVSLRRFAFLGFLGSSSDPCLVWPCRLAFWSVWSYMVDKYGHCSIASMWTKASCLLPPKVSKNTRHFLLTKKLWSNVPDHLKRERRRFVLQSVQLYELYRDRAGPLFFSVAILRTRLEDLRPRNSHKLQTSLKCICHLIIHSAFEWDPNLLIQSFEGRRLEI